MTQKKDSAPPAAAGLDIGTTKVCVVVGKRGPDGGTEITGFGIHPSSGLKSGVVVNMEETADSIRSAARKAERMCGHVIREVTVGIAGGHVKGIKGRGMVTLRESEVTPRDVERVMESANALPIPEGKEIIHAIAQEYTVDRESGIRDPVGIHGLKLEADVHIVAGDAAAARNIAKCVETAGMSCAGMVLGQMASSEAVLTPDEKEIGVAMIDFGGGTCDIAVFVNGNVRYTESLTLGGGHLDKDISFGLSVPLSEAKKLKENHALAPDGSDEDWGGESIEVKSARGQETKHVPKKDLEMIVRMRIEEIFEIVKQRLSEQGFAGMLPAGAVLTGGSSAMKGITELVGRVLGMPVRMGAARDVDGAQEALADPACSAAVGLLRYAGLDEEPEAAEKVMKRKNVFAKMEEWLNEFF